MLDARDSGLQNSEVHIDALILLFCTQIASDITNFVKTHVKPRVVSARGISLTELQILVEISRHSRRMTPTEIAEVLRFDRSSITRSVKKLEKKELVFIESDMRDLRSINVLPTDKGQAICEEYHKWFVTAFAEMDRLYGIAFTDEQRDEIVKTLRILARRTYLLSSERRPIDISLQLEHAAG